jgi:hypothetical protein
MNTTKACAIAIMLGFLLLMISNNCFADQNNKVIEFSILQKQFYALEKMKELRDTGYNDLLNARLEDDISRFQDLLFLFSDEQSPSGDRILITPGIDIDAYISCIKGNNSCICVGRVSCLILEGWCALVGGDYSESRFGPEGGCLLPD